MSEAKEPARRPMMKCGHAANATRGKDGKPCCVICFGTNPGAVEVDNDPPSLEGREAHCFYRDPGRHGAQGGEIRDDRHGIVPSSTDLPFFESHPDKSRDVYYCGCHGWD